MFTGKKDNWLGIFPKPGISDEDILSAKKYGEIVLEHFKNNNLHNLQSELIKNKRLRFGTIDSWLIWNLTNGKSFFTDPSNASRTMLFNIRKNKYDSSRNDK